MTENFCNVTAWTSHKIATAYHTTTAAAWNQHLHGWFWCCWRKINKKIIKNENVSRGKNRCLISYSFLFYIYSGRIKSYCNTLYNTTHHYDVSKTKKRNKRYYDRSFFLFVKYSRGIKLNFWFYFERRGYNIDSITHVNTQNQVFQKLRSPVALIQWYDLKTDQESTFKLEDVVNFELEKQCRICLQKVILAKDQLQTDKWEVITIADIFKWKLWMYLG